MQAISARAVVVREARAPAAVEEIVVDPPGPGEVRLRVLATGVCHTDLHAKLGNFGTEFPYLLGHEATGVVEEVGAGVVRPGIGDVVVLTWRAPCGVCRFCQTGRPVRCAWPAVAGQRLRTKDGAALGRVLGVGSFATHTVVAAGQAIPVAPDLDPRATCLIGCCVATGVGAAVLAARMPPGATCAVFGCGAVGLSVIQGARILGATRIFAVDVTPSRLEAARRMGATDAVLSGPGQPDAAKVIRERSDGGVAYAFEAVGLPATLAQAMAATELGGTAVLIGVPVPGSSLTYPMVKLFYGRTQVLTTFGGDALPARDFPLFFDWYRRGTLPLDELVTARAPLSSVNEAFAAMQRGAGLRTVLVPGE